MHLCYCMNSVYICIKYVLEYRDALVVENRRVVGLQLNPSLFDKLLKNLADVDVRSQIFNSAFYRSVNLWEYPLQLYNSPVTGD